MTERKETIAHDKATQEQAAHEKVAAAIAGKVVLASEQKSPKDIASAAQAAIAALQSQSGTSSPALTDVTSTGARLRRRREALSLTAEDVAGSLKIPVRKIKAIESERWEALPTGPYLRGFLRAYAKVLRINAEELIAEVDSSLMQSRSPDTILRMPQSFETPLPRPPIDAGDWKRGRRLIGLGLVILILIGLLLWSGTQSFKETETWLRASAGLPAVVSAPAATVAEAKTVGNDSLSSAMPNPLPDQAAVSATDAATSTNPPASDVVTPAGTSRSASASTSISTSTSDSNMLAFEFQGESWVQVRQADGKVLMSQINAANTRSNIEGNAPFELIIGNANQVRLQYRGAVIDLAPHTRDNVARLTVQ